MDELKKAVEILRQGGVIVYPTDTVWGVGCDATNSEAVGRIYELKGSVNKKGMIVLTDTIDSVGRYFRSVPAVALELFECSDKPLTVILEGACSVAPELVPQEGTLAIRVPNHDFCRQIIKLLGRAVVSTSANFSGAPTPVKFTDIDVSLLSKVDYVVPLQFEGHPTGQPSSIIQIGTSAEVKIIRA